MEIQQHALADLKSFLQYLFGSTKIGQRTQFLKGSEIQTADEKAGVHFQTVMFGLGNQNLFSSLTVRP
ncbi:hypothetical protein AYJ05_03445 [Corynebacterium stationis]|uniref:Uncharacterized protein n=1 Tax=Corynebacterium stationis TaxID=1705 RepID=A0A177IEL3_9CORY|nr:hypothetical protein AYJ05_03445 [Corynebacterium stationis]